MFLVVMPLNNVDNGQNVLVRALPLSFLFKFDHTRFSSIISQVSLKMHIVKLLYLDQ